MLNAPAGLTQGKPVVIAVDAMGGDHAPTAVVRGTGIRVQTLVTAAHTWGLPPAQIAAEYDLPVAHVQEALAFYTAHQDEIDAALAADDAREAVAHGAPTAAPGC